VGVVYRRRSRFASENKSQGLPSSFRAPKELCSEPQIRLERFFPPSGERRARFN